MCFFHGWKMQFKHEKTCTICGLTQSRELFPKKGKHKGKQYYRSVCSDCFNSKQTNPKHYQLIRNYDLTLDGFNKMLADQGGVCAICKQTNKNGKALAVDHDHETGDIRQLLCSNCNTGIGLLKDNPQLLIEAANYLIKHKNNGDNEK
ncbi:hypothetical protein GTR47_004461 [Salmonella enterica]|nr:hypothetical protein [Salmonella enterica]